MSLFKRILGMGKADPEKTAASAVSPNGHNETAKNELSLREKLLSDNEFFNYVNEVASSRQTSVDGIDDTQLFSLFDVWTSERSKPSVDNSTLVTIGVGALAALAVYSPPASAGIGDEIAKQLMKLIGPYIQQGMSMVTSTIGLDIENGSMKQAIASGKTADAANEVAKTVYNKEAARAAEPAPGGCVSKEMAARTVSAENHSRLTAKDIFVTRNSNKIHLSTSVRNVTDRIRQHQDNTRIQAIKVQGVSANAPAKEQVVAMVKTASVTTIDSKSQYDKSDEEKAKAHVQVLFGDTAARNDIEVEAHTPEQKAAVNRQIETYATLDHCRSIFDKDITERVSANPETPSFRAMVQQKADSEYSSEEFLKELEGITHAAPALKTLISQQAFSNKLAVKQYEQQQEMLRLMALQLKETVRSNM